MSRSGFDEVSLVADGYRSEPVECVSHWRWCAGRLGMVVNITLVVNMIHMRVQLRVGHACMCAWGVGSSLNVIVARSDPSGTSTTASAKRYRGYGK